eukprot:3294664-Lingulodinium_polyedra.AAC.1
MARHPSCANYTQRSAMALPQEETRRLTQECGTCESADGHAHAHGRRPGALATLNDQVAELT